MMSNDEQEGDVVVSPGCDSVGVMGYVLGVMGVMIIFLSLVMVIREGVKIEKSEIADSSFGPLPPSTRVRN